MQHFNVHLDILSPAVYITELSPSSLQYELILVADLLYLLQGVTKGLVAEKIFSSMAEDGKLADFVLCIGDDRSDEDMFEIIGNALSSNILSPTASVFACTVGQKPSKAKYYLDDTAEVISMLEYLAEASSPLPSSDDEKGEAES